MTDYASQAGISIHARFLALQWLLYFTKVTVEVDGVPEVGKWGDRFTPTSPGRHEVAVYFRYVFYRRCGLASVVVDVPAGQIVSFKYRAPLILTMAGKLKPVS